MDERLREITDRLGPLLSEARNMLHLQDRAIAAGIMVDNTFVRCRIEGWDKAIVEARDRLADLSDAGGAPTEAKPAPRD